MERSELLSGIRDLFRARQDVYAKGFPKKDRPEKYAYVKVTDSKGNTEPLTDDVLYNHLKGEQIIGLYPIVNSDQVYWAALDFDDVEDPLKLAFDQVKAFRRAGLFAYAERSRSGTGMHVWLFFDQPVSCLKLRRVVFSLLLDTKNYDMMFPNQDSAEDGYGNLIALPYFGKAYTQGNSAFVDEKGEKISPTVFLTQVRRNNSEIIDRLFSKLPAELQAATNRSGPSLTRSLPVMKLPGAMKACTYCNWMQQAKVRMPNQNQEPELYALACQFSQLEGGEELLKQYGALHPYSPDRIREKWERATEQNKPDTCASIREKFGDCYKRCDTDIKGVSHPYDLARVPFTQLETSQKAEPESYKALADQVFERARKVANKEIEPGLAFGWDALDNQTELRDGDLIIVAARPSIGKTAFVVDLLANIASRGTPGYMASLEMTKEQFGGRLLARKSGVDKTLIDKGLLSPSDWRKLTESKEIDLPIYVDDRAKDIDQILDFFADMVAKHGKGIGVIDYAELISQLPGESDVQHMKRVTKSCKSIAKILGIPIVLLAQLNRFAEQEQAEGNEPKDSWLKLGGEQDTDVMIFMLGKKEDKTIVRRDLVIIKERNRGAAGARIKMELHQSIYRFFPRTGLDDAAEGSFI